MAGNVGTPLASLAGELDPRRDRRLRVPPASSSRTPRAFAPECAVFLNLAPDHLDRHGTLEAYLAAKLRIFANQGNDDVAVYNGDEPELRDRDLGGCARRVRFCPVEAPEGVADPDCELSLRGGVDLRRRASRCCERRRAAAAGSPQRRERDGAPPRPRSPRASRATPSREGLRSFEGVPHRLERVRELGGVLYVNDSKATNVASALAGIERLRGRRAR